MPTHEQAADAHTKDHAAATSVAIGVAVIVGALALWIGKYQRQGRANRAYLKNH